jgi:hypothetical protein
VGFNVETVTYKKVKFNVWVCYSVLVIISSIVVVVFLLVSIFFEDFLVLFGGFWQFY